MQNVSFGFIRLFFAESTSAQTQKRYFTAGRRSHRAGSCKVPFLCNHILNACPFLKGAYDTACSLAALIYIASITGNERIMGYW